MWVLSCVPWFPRHERVTYSEHFTSTKCWRSRVFEDLVTNDVLVKNCSPMSDYEEGSIDVQSFSKLSSANSLGGAYRAEATDQWSTVSGVTVKIPPLFDRSISWFKNEELIDNWLDLTQLEAGKRGPALMIRLFGDASIYKKLLDRKPLTSEDGVKYFVVTLRPHFTKGVQSVFLQRCFYLFRAGFSGNK